MKTTKIRQTVMVTLAISVSSLISFNLLTDGFIISLSVLVMGILIYCYWNLGGVYIAWFASVFSPFFRLTVQGIQDGFHEQLILLILPDMFYFLAYGIMYGIISSTDEDGQRKPMRFFATVLVSDVTGNVSEMLMRSGIAGRLLITPNTFAVFVLVAIIRTSLVFVVIIAIEYYTAFILNKERNDMFEKLLNQASVFEDELRIMEKNVEEIELVTKLAYDLHHLDEKSTTREIKMRALDIAKRSHEIKGDYRNVINRLKDVYVNELGDEKMMLSEIINLEKRNLLAAARARDYTVSVNIKVRDDYEVKNPFKLMSVIRNILTNSMEAFVKKDGSIQVVMENDDSGEENGYCVITIKDNGCGIDPENLDFVDMEGYSTKFNSETGNIQRGLGLPIVRDIVENEYDGSMEIESALNKGTAVRLRLSTARLGARE